MATITKQFPGTANLEETCRALRKAQADNTANLTSLEAVENERTDGTKVNLNVATFEQVNRARLVLDELLCIDVSNNAGAVAATAAGGTHKPVGGAGKEFEIWVQNKLTTVQVFARKSKKS